MVNVREWRCPGVAEEKLALASQDLTWVKKDLKE